MTREEEKRGSEKGRRAQVTPDRSRGINTNAGGGKTRKGVTAVKTHLIWVKKPMLSMVKLKKALLLSVRYTN